jgi:2-oxoacid:acceptor oxidoreductase delta subunit (pyruvate/2-ketoisovalerate family)
MIKPCEQKVLPRSKMRNLSVKDRGKGFLSVEFGFRRGEAIKEAQRCLGLRECESCDLCSLLCPDLCITRNEKTGEVLIDLDYCKGCGICAAICPKGAIEMVQDMSGNG